MADAGCKRIIHGGDFIHVDHLHRIRNSRRLLVLLRARIYSVPENVASANPMYAQFAASRVEQSGIAVLLIRPPLTLHVAHAHPGDLGVDPGHLPGHRFQNHFLQFHHPLRLSGGYRLAWFHSASFLLPGLDRTTHILITPDNSHANDTMILVTLSLTSQVVRFY